jgi:hypothetical protein
MAKSNQRYFFEDSARGRQALSNGKAVVAEVDWQAQRLHCSEKEAVILAIS